jgi:hypothetical protein
MDSSADTLEADENILSHTVSDEALEAAAGMEKGEYASVIPPQSAPCLLRCYWE